MSDSQFDCQSPREAESGYASGCSSEASMPDIFFSKAHLKFINQQLAKLEPEEILRWCLITLPSLFQTTAFGLSGLVTLDILSRLPNPTKTNVDLIFLDTLHHFSETLTLVERIKRRYTHFNLHVYKPAGCETAEDFAANWSFSDVKNYIEKYNVPYNELLDRGYKSVGDWHSTQPVAQGEDERAGRWKGREKSECGIHNKKSRYAQFLAEQERKRQEEALSKALESAHVGAS